MRRREFISVLFGSAAAWPLSVAAQSHKIPRIAVLMGAAENLPDTKTRIAAFRQGLAERGWNDGENIKIEYRFATGDAKLIQQLASELVASGPDVILANGTAVVAAFKELTQSIPVVFALAIDPVGLGYAQSLSRPGGNLTGFTFINPELIGKWMGLLKEVAPGVTRVALLFNPSTSPFYLRFLQEVRASLPAGSIEIADAPVESAAEIATTIEVLGHTRGSGLVIGPGPLNQIQIKSLAALATKHRVPAISVYRPFVTEGGLMAYGPDTADLFHRSAAYVDRILKGEKPAELPVQQPSKFEFALNLKTAVNLGLTIPASLLATADEVIE